MSVNGGGGYGAVVRALEALSGHGCTTCGRALCAHEAVLCVALKVESRPRCVTCFAAAFGLDEGAVVRHFRTQASNRSLFIGAWLRADAIEPACVLASRSTFEDGGGI